MAALLLSGCPSSNHPPDDNGNGTSSFTLSVQPVGNGSIESDPHAIDCPGICQATLDEGTTVTLIATPHTGHTFDGWTGDHDCHDGTLTPTPDGGHTFSGWSGDPDCSDGQVTMTADLTCTARFHQPTYFVALRAGHYHALAIDRDGQAWAWGDNTSGQLGDGSLAPHQASPVKVTHPTTTSFTAVSPGANHSLAFDTQGNAWSWGYDSDGQLGDPAHGTQQEAPVPVDMPDGVTFVAIDAGYAYVLALDTTGKAWAWGANGTGQLGDGSHGTDRPTPVTVDMPPETTWACVSAGGVHSLALDVTGAACAWGDDGAGQLGDGSITVHESVVPIPVSMPRSVAFSEVSAGGGFSLALDAADEAWAWGRNDGGQLGTGSAGGNVDAPVQVEMP